jgi:uncharacterized protein (DUF1697 family)
MRTYVALLRGINVIGSHRLPMKDLERIFARSGCAGVRTYIQSGNVIFRAAVGDRVGFARRIAAEVARSHGFEPRVIVLTRGELDRAARGNPFREAEHEPKSLHLFFLAEAPRRPALRSIEALRAGSERFALEGKVLYLHTPDGFGRSVLAGRVERLLGVEATARNWRTVTRLLEMDPAPASSMQP